MSSARFLGWSASLFRTCFSLKFRLNSPKVASLFLMNPSAPRLLVVILCFLGATTVLPAQLVLSYPTTDTTPASVSGQSFTPGDAGFFPTDYAYLTQITFQVSSGPNVPSGPVYLDIYADSGFTSFVGSSSNSQTWTSADDLAIETWSFAYLALEKSTTYYAV
jgi:hypothetical protein